MDFQEMIMHDEHLMSEIMSFCDFFTLFKFGRSCRKMKEVSDQAINSWVDTLCRQKLPLEYGISSKDATTSETTVLQRGWSDGFQSRLALIETAVDRFTTFAQFPEFNEDRARYLLRRNNKADSSQFDPDNETDASEEGWTIRILYHESLSKEWAAPRIWSRTEDQSSNDEVETQGQSSTTRHAAMCLLWKSTFLEFASIKYEVQHSDYPRERVDSVLMMAIPAHGEVELKYDFNFQCL